MPILVIPWVVIQELDSLKVTSLRTIDLLPDNLHGNYNYVIIFLSQQFGSFTPLFLLCCCNMNGFGIKALKP